MSTVSLTLGMPKTVISPVGLQASSDLEANA